MDNQIHIYIKRRGSIVSHELGGLRSMAIIEELIRTESDGSISFGNYLLDTKSKVQDFEHNGDLYKVKTYHEITKLEKNGLFVYESVPGTSVNKMKVTQSGLEFTVEGREDTQITVELEYDTEYKIYINDINVGKMKTNLGGKLMMSVELNTCSNSVDVRVVRV